MTLTALLGEPVRYRSGDRAAVEQILADRGDGSIHDGMAIACEHGINDRTPRTAEKPRPPRSAKFAERMVKQAMASA